MTVKGRRDDRWGPAYAPSRSAKAKPDGPCRPNPPTPSHSPDSANFSGKFLTFRYRLGGIRHRREPMSQRCSRLSNARLFNAISIALALGGGLLASAAVSAQTAPPVTGQPETPA